MVEIPTNLTLLILAQFTDYTRKSLTVSEIARLVGKSHVSLLPHLEKLEQLQVLRSSTKGRNRELAIQKTPACRYFLEMAENYKAIQLQQTLVIRKLCEEISPRQGIILVFGSYANGTATKHSDIDLVVEKYEKFSTFYGKSINTKILDMENRQDHLMQEILRNHVVINGCSDFVSQVLYGQTSVVQEKRYQTDPTK
ncbi:MAG: nucleotidyltransferase domain-containing protein [Nanobdellota archaeon]